MGNWQTRDRKRNRRHKEKNHKKFYDQPQGEQKLDKNVIREQRRQIEQEQEYDLDINN